MWHRCGPSCLCSDSRLAVKIILPFKTFDCLLVLWFSNDKVTNTEKLVCVCRCVLMENRLLFPSLYKHRRKKIEFRELRGGERRGVSALIGCASFMAPQPGRYSVCWISISISELWIILWTLHTWQPSSSDPGPSPADVQKNCGREKKKRAKIQLSELSLKQNKWLEG